MSQLQHPYAVKIQTQTKLGPYLAIPLSSDTPVGVLTLTRLEGAPAFTADEIELTELLGHQAGLAWHLGRVESDQQRLSTLEDRDRTSRSRNDETLQRLFALNTTLQRLAARAGSAEDAATLGRAVTDVDELVRHLRPTVKPPPRDTTTLGALQATLQTVLAPLAATLDFRPELRVDIANPLAIPTALTTVIVGVVHDTAQHAATSSDVESLDIHIHIDDDWLVLDNLELGTNAIDDWAYPLRADLEDRAEDFDGLSTLTIAGARQRRLTWRAPLS